MNFNRSSFAVGLWVMASVLGAQSREPQTYGTTAVSYVEIPGVAFVPYASSQSYSDGGLGNFGRYTPGCEGDCMFAPLRLPSGAKIVSIELDAVDSDGFDAAFGNLWQCDKFGLNCSAHPAAGLGDCGLPGYICSGKSFSGGSVAVIADVSTEGLVVDNTTTSFFLGASGDTASETVGGMIVGYVLQVSPEEVAHFADVPPSNPQFQFIEALFASGVTAGCGGGNFCPNSPLTRGQMAVFLAKALGLQWP